MASLSLAPAWSAVDDAPVVEPEVEPVEPEVEPEADEPEAEPVEPDDEPEVVLALLPLVPRPLLPSEPLLPAALLGADDDEPRLPLDDALCSEPDDAVEPLFRLESLPMLEPALFMSLPLPSVDF